VADVISLLIKILKKTKRYGADVFNVGTGVGYSVPYLYQEFSRIAGVKIDAVYKDPASFWSSYGELSDGPLPLDPDRVKKEVYKESIAYIAKTVAEFGWHPSIDIRHGLDTVYQFAKRHG
jgi:nucleoside-diphosphate-sugar epimerase